MIQENATLKPDGKCRELLYVLNDASPSMDDTDYAPSRKDGAILATQRLIETKLKHHPQDRVGIITFAGDAQLNHTDIEVCNGAESLINSLRNLKTPDGGTNFIAPLIMAETIMSGGEIPQQPKSLVGSFLKSLFVEPEESPLHLRKNSINAGIVTKRIILLTDGQHNYEGSPEIVAERIKNAGITIECIGIAGSQGEVDEQLLKKIASKDKRGQPMYSFIKDTDKLIKKYESMAKHIRPI